MTWNIICAIIIGIPILAFAFIIWGCVTIAIMDAVRTYGMGESKPLGRMLGRMKRK